MARAKKKAGEINSSSMADISFLLLIFFLVTTTMDVDTGMKRTLPPWIDPTEQQNDVDVNERNVLKVNVSKEGNIMVGTEILTAKNLKRNTRFNGVNHSLLSLQVYQFLSNPDASSKKETEIDGKKIKVSEGLVSLKADNESKYKIYLQVQDELTFAFNLYRDEIAREVYGVSYDELDDIQAANIRKAVPMKISEAEPNDQTKK
ncbi:MAG: biopolymer transporter ExbD [Alistipes sp.]|nr:biopolymer transporter ExbD [Alistipes sp.]